MKVLTGAKSCKEATNFWSGHVSSAIFPQTGLPVGFYLRKKIDWTRWWARWVWLGADLALLGALGWVGRRVWPCWARWLCWACWARWLGWAWCWAWGLAVRACWARWLGWAWCWARWVWLGADLALLGALGWVGRRVWPCWARCLRWVGRGVGRAGRAGWVGRGVWCWAHWAVLDVGFGRAGRAGWVGRGVGRGVWPCWAHWLGWAWCWACWARWLGWAWKDKSMLSKFKSILSKYKSILWKYKSTLPNYKSIPSK